MVLTARAYADAVNSAASESWTDVEVSSYGSFAVEGTDITIKAEDIKNVAVNLNVLGHEFKSTKTAFKEDFALPYSSERTYAEGEYTIYENTFYICTSEITEPQEWDGSHWTATSVGEELSALKKFVGESKKKIADALAGKGMSASEDDTWEDLAKKVEDIPALSSDITILTLTNSQGGDYDHDYTNWHSSTMSFSWRNTTGSDKWVAFNSGTGQISSDDDNPHLGGGKTGGYEATTGAEKGIVKIAAGATFVYYQTWYYKGIYPRLSGQVPIVY